MQGILRFSVHMLEHLAPDLEEVVRGFITQGTVIAIKDIPDRGERHWVMDHPHFTEPDSSTEYMLYLGNRLNRTTMNMEPRLLHVDKVGRNGKLSPVWYATT
jgi:hypothetical protein